MSSEIFHHSPSNGDYGAYLAVYTGARGAEDCFLFLSSDDEYNEVPIRLSRADAERLVAALRRDLDKGTPGQAVRAQHTGGHPFPGETGKHTLSGTQETSQS